MCVAQQIHSDICSENLLITHTRTYAMLCRGTGAIVFPQNIALRKERGVTGGGRIVRSPRARVPGTA
jgi:hypothetical protein